MKKYAILSLMLLFTSVYSRASNSKSISELLNQPLVVVLDSHDAVYNDYVQHAVQNFWTINTYTFITEEEFEQTKNDAESLFLIRNHKQSLEDEGTTVYDNVMKLVYFIKNGRLVNDLAGTPVIPEENDIKISVINAVRVLQDKVQFMLFKEESNKAAFASYDKKVESRSTIIKANDLYIASEDIASNADMKEIMNLYNGQIHIVSREELNALIDSKAADIYYGVVFTRKTSNVSYINTKQIVSAFSGEVIYKAETTTMKPGGFDKKEIKSLAE